MRNAFELKQSEYFRKHIAETEQAADHVENRINVMDVHVEIAGEIADIASELDGISPQLRKVSDSLHLIAERLAGNRNNEIYGDDDE